MTDRAIRELIQSEHAIDCLAQLAELPAANLNNILKQLKEYEKQGIRD